MQSMSFDPAVADIGSQVVNNAFQGLQAGAVAWVSLSSLLPAGAEEVSAWAVTAFTTAATGLLALVSAAGRAEKGGRGVYRDRPDVLDADVRAAACLLEAIPRPGQTLARE
ncbi:PE family protein [Mycobacterium tuberculosis CAS/NITR204]|uniref:PE family protein n=1 Tax=Mycobacterium tuberculosis CAS/NITR204 TaxID=1310114 RepID=R4MBW1_MYCTX|nr:PE family protein [Mycobacterium tuberculosis CAS/NITR204]